MNESKTPEPSLEFNQGMNFEQWWRVYFASYQYGNEEAASAKGFARAAWMACIALAPDAPTPPAAIKESLTVQPAQKKYQRIDNITLDRLFYIYAGPHNSIDRTYVVELAYDLRDARAEITYLHSIKSAYIADINRLEAEVARLQGVVQSALDFDIVERSSEMVYHEACALNEKLRQALAPQAPASPAPLDNPNTSKLPASSEIPAWWPDCPYPETVFPMTQTQLIAAIPDENQRKAISGFYGRMFWGIASKTIFDSWKYDRDFGDELPPGVPEPTMDNRDGEAEA